MTEMGDDFRELAEKSRLKRAANRTSSAQILMDAGVIFESKNMGAHLIVSHDGETIDFWPGTGLWIVRYNGLRGRGIKSMLKWLFDEQEITVG